MATALTFPRPDAARQRRPGWWRTLKVMPLPRAVARFNLIFTNPILRHIAWWAPGFAVLTHVGRKSGRVRRTPVNIFAHGREYVIALTYGRDSEWVKNVQAAGGCLIQTRGRHIRLVHPRVVHDPSHRMMPAPVRAVLRLIGVSDFLVLEPATGAP
jgi:deazaflavin-dependent oxidoreductase (nitroreductase family)